MYNVSVFCVSIPFSFTVCRISLFHVIMCFMFDLNWIDKYTHTHWTVNYGGIFDLVMLKPLESDTKMLLKHSENILTICTEHWRFILTQKSSV